MGLLDQISQMKRDGLSDEEITMKLQEQGSSPRAINDAFNQNKIKTAVSAEGKETLEDYTPKTPQVPALPQRTFYQPKTHEAEEPEQESYYTPKEYAQEPPQPLQNQQNYQEEYASYPEGQMQEEYYPAEGYEGGYEGYEEGYSDAYTADTIIEIAEQVFSEKMKKFEKQIEEFNEFVNLSQTKLSNNDQRLKRMEAIIDKLQIAILEKIGSYGKSIEGIKKEMEMIEDSFSKILPELKKKKTSSKKKKG